MSSLFGSKTEKTEIPGWLKDAATEMLDRSLSLGKTGYMPYAGPEVAALTPDQLAARQNTNSAASAFGMNVGGLGTPGAQDFGNGIWGHSSLPLYEQQMDWMQQNRPGQLDYYNSHFIDPVTGAPGANMNQQNNGQVDNRTEWQRKFDEGTVSTMHPLASGERNVFYGGGGGVEPGDMMGTGFSQGGQTFGGYTGLADMFNGGGAGASGARYQGGGLLSNFGNARNERKGTTANSGGLFGGWF